MMITYFMASYSDTHFTTMYLSGKLFIPAQCGHIFKKSTSACMYQSAKFNIITRKEGQNVPLKT